MAGGVLVSLPPWLFTRLSAATELQCLPVAADSLLYLLGSRNRLPVGASIQLKPNVRLVLFPLPSLLNFPALSFPLLFLPSVPLLSLALSIPLAHSSPKSS